MLEDIIRRATMNASAQFKRLGYISSNAVNLNTNTYKVRSFDQYLDEAGNVQATVRVDARKGSIELTNNPMDVAIDGPGYFYVTKTDGSTAYTRDGRFMLNAQGYLTTVSGALVGNGIQLPVNYYKMDIESDGTVKVRVKESDAPQVVGKINIVNFANPGALKDLGGNLCGQTEASGEPEAIEKVSTIKQNFTERSNGNVWDVISDVMKTNASFIPGLRIIKYTDEMYRQSVNLRQ